MNHANNNPTGANDGSTGDQPITSTKTDTASGSCSSEPQVPQSSLSSSSLSTIVGVQQQLQEWPADPNMYQLIGKIGQGAFATVWKAYRLMAPTHQATGTSTTTANGASSLASSTNSTSDNLLARETLQGSLSISASTTATTCAIKVLNLDNADATNLVEIRLEVQAMRLLSHVNVLTCYTAFVNDRNLWLITPLMEKGSALYSLQSVRKIIRRSKRQLQEKFRSNDSTEGFISSSTATNDMASSSTSLSFTASNIQSHEEQYQIIQQQQQQIQLPKHPIHMEQHIMYILHETIVGLQYIHENLQIHRDIKGGNILVDSNGCIKIADFGVSSFLLLQNGSLYQHEKAKTFVGTPCWMAPEVMEQVNGYDYKADIWSLGITALELAKGYAPYAKYPPMKVLILTIQEDPPSLASYDVETGFTSSEDDYGDSSNNPIIETYSSEFEDFVRLCLQKDPSQRPTCTELLASKHFMDYSSLRQSRIEAMRDDICSIVKDVGYKLEEQHQRAASILGQQKQQTTTQTFGAAAGINDDATVMAGNKPKSEIIQERVSAIEDRPAGTTWVFSLDEPSSSNSPAGNENDVIANEGTSLTMSSSDGLQQQQDVSTERTVRRRGSGQQLQYVDIVGDEYDDVLADLDEFERQTGGENYDRQRQIQQDTEQQQVNTDRDEIQQEIVATNSSFEEMHLEETIGDINQPKKEVVEVVETDDLNQFMDEFEQNTGGEDFRRSS